MFKIGKRFPKDVTVVINPYNSSDSRGRKGVMVHGPWSGSIRDFIGKKGIKALYLNSSKGWRGEDYSFLSQLHDVEELNIISSSANGLSAIEGMKNLRELNITVSTSDVVDFSKLLNLEKCYLYWWKGAESLFWCKSLKKLYLDELKLKDYIVFSRLKNLNSLTIANSPVESIEWIADLKKLSELEFLNCRKISNFLPVGNCNLLKTLRISGSVLLSELSFVSGLKKLEVLDISENGQIESLSPLSPLKNLKALSFAGKTEIEDGNLSILEQLPKLGMLMFRGRRHYSHKLVKKWNWDNFNIPDKLLEKK